MKKIIIGVVILLVVAGGLIYWKTAGASTTSEDTDILPTPSIALPTISGVSVDLTPKNDNKVMVLTVKGIPADVSSVEYELTYMTGEGLPRGVLGKITLKEGQSEVTRDDIVLGTCSSGKCVYDTGVTKVDLSLKFNTGDGAKVFQQSYTL